MRMRRVLAALLLLAALLGMAGTAWADYPEATSPSWNLDASWDAATLVPADVEPGEIYWQIRLAYYNSDAMDHSLWLYVVDRDAAGVIADGGRVMVRNEANGYEGQMGTKPPPEWADWPMYKNDNLTFWIEDALGRKSDRVTLIRQVPQDGTSLPVGVNLFHIGRMFSIQLRQKPAMTATATPAATSTPVAGGAWAVIEQSDGRIVIERR